MTNILNINAWMEIIHITNVYLVSKRIQLKTLKVKRFQLLNAFSMQISYVTDYEEKVKELSQEFLHIVKSWININFYYSNKNKRFIGFNNQKSYQPWYSCKKHKYNISFFKVAREQIKHWNRHGRLIFEPIWSSTLPKFNTSNSRS